MIFRRRVLLFVLISIIVSTGYAVFVRTITSPQKTKPLQNEKLEDSMARVYENFLHKTKYSYQMILESGTNYTNQERVFVELTKKMKALEGLKNTEYSEIQNLLVEEIRKNRKAFESFYVKATKSNLDELQRLVQERNKQYDIVLEGN